VGLGRVSTTSYSVGIRGGGLLHAVTATAKKASVMRFMVHLPGAMDAPLIVYSGSVGGDGCATTYLMLSNGMTRSAPSTSARIWRAAKISFSRIPAAMSFA